jgi:hypothetical protein
LALPLPTMKYEIAFSTDPLAATPTYEDVTAYVQHCGPKRGRDHERSRMEAGTCTLLLNNRDRRFDPTWTGGPYGANVKPMRKVRVSATWAGVTYRRFTGFIESWLPEWPDQANSDVEVRAVDGFKVLALKKISGTAYSDAILATSNLVGYYRLDEKNGDLVAADSGPGNHNGTYKGEIGYDTAGALPAEPNSAIHFGASSGYADLGWVPFTGTGNFTIEMWVYPQGPGLAFTEGDGSADLLFVEVRDDWRVNIQAYDLTNGGWAIGNTPLTPFAWNHVVFVKSGTTGPANWHIYINGVDSGFFDSQLLGSGNVNLSSCTDAYIAGSNTGTPVAIFDGALDEVALYSSALSSTTVANHYAKVGTFREPALAGARINEILDAVGWPSADRDIDDGQFLMQAATEPLWTTEALPYILDMVEAEGFPAIAYIAGDGKFVFHDRGHGTPATSGIFGDGATDLRYELDGMQPAMDESEIWNEVIYQATKGKAQSASDSASQSDYVIRTLTKTGLLNASDADVATLVADDLARYKDPAVRLPAMPVHPLDDVNTLFPQVLGSELNSRKTVGRSLIPGGGDPWRETVRVEGIADDIDHRTGDWRTIWQLGVDMAFLGAPSVRTYRSTAQAITNSTDTALTFNTNRWDDLPSGLTGPQHSTSSNTNRLTCKSPGKYIIFGNVVWAGSAAGSRTLYARLNGSQLLDSDSKSNDGTNVVRMDVSTVYELSVGDYVELVVFQDSGGGLNVITEGGAGAEFGWQWVGD